jgi:HK97 family phage prohead protease
MKKVKHDFSGYATKSGIKCSDGRTILKDAFKHNDGQKVPLVWQHLHNDPSNVLGHAILENRDDGVYTYGIFNNSAKAKVAKELVEHGDIVAMSIYANSLKQKGKDVLHGDIREVSLVLSPANPGALIENITLEHGDGEYEASEDEAVIYNGQNLAHNDEDEDEEDDGEDDLEHADDKDGDETVADVINTLNEKQKTVFYAIIARAINEKGTAKHSNIEGEGDKKIMKHNVFSDKDRDQSQKRERIVLEHSQITAIFTDAQKCGSLKQAFIAHADDITHATTYGIENIDYLFPDAKTLTPTPEMISRDMSWVPGVLNGTYHSPFSRIKTMSADITADTARAKGYVKGALKKEEFFTLAKRITTPTTVYKKQKLDRDDIVDITDLDIVAWMKVEMRMMLDEELARAFLVGDGREADDEDKINENNIRPIYKDDDLYAYHVEIPGNTSALQLIDLIVRAMNNYKGSGSPNLYTTQAELTEMLLLRDKQDRRLYRTKAELAQELLVNDIIPVPPMEGLERTTATGKHLRLFGIIVNLKDYAVGADKGGAVSMFDDFDIDFNQQKYLIETRCSGALRKMKSAIVLERDASALIGG